MGGEEKEDNQRGSEEEGKGKGTMKREGWEEREVKEVKEKEIKGKEGRGR